MRIVENTPDFLRLRHQPTVAPAFCAALLASEAGVLVVHGAELPLWQWGLVAALAIAMGAACGVSVIGTRACFDGRASRLRWRRTSPFRLGRDAVEVPLDSIVRVGVEELPPGADTGPSWRVFVATRKRSLPFAMGFANWGDPEALAETIRGWLHARGVSVD